LQNFINWTNASQYWKFTILQNTPCALGFYLKLKLQRILILNNFFAQFLAVDYHPLSLYRYFPSSCITCWSKNISLRSRLALNMNTLECILISVIELGGRDWATATKPTFWYPGSKLPARSPPMLWCLIFR
jgi:hypothetical protein